MIAGKVTEADYLRAMRLHRRSSQRVYYFISALTAMSGAAIYICSQQMGIIVMGAGLGGVAGELICSFLYLPWKVRRLYGQHKALQHELKYSWDTTHINLSYVDGQGRHRWTDFARYKEDEHVFLLYLQDGLFELVPKRWFQDSSQLANFRQLASQANQS